MSNAPQPHAAVAAVSPDERLDATLKAVDFVIRRFRVDRYIYLALTTVSALMLLAAVANMLWRDQKDPVALGAVFGSSGFLTYSLSRVLTIWNQIIAIVAKGIV